MATKLEQQLTQALMEQLGMHEQRFLLESHIVAGVSKVQQLRQAVEAAKRPKEHKDA